MHAVEKNKCAPPNVGLFVVAVLCVCLFVCLFVCGFFGYFCCFSSYIFQNNLFSWICPLVDYLLCLLTLYTNKQTLLDSDY